MLRLVIAFRCEHPRVVLGSSLLQSLNSLCLSRTMSAPGRLKAFPRGCYLMFVLLRYSWP